MLGVNRKRGSAMLEFALTGVPLICIWISITQMAIGMWRYHSIQYAVKTAGSYIAVHGSDCAVGSNTCNIQIKDAAAVLSANMAGLNPSTVRVTFNVMGSDHTSVVTQKVCQLNNCLTDTTAWPTIPGAGTVYAPPGTDIEIYTQYLFQSALLMVAPGPGAGVVKFGTFGLPGFTHQTVLF